MSKSGKTIHVQFFSLEQLAGLIRRVAYNRALANNIKLQWVENQADGFVERMLTKIGNWGWTEVDTDHRQISVEFEKNKLKYWDDFIRLSCTNPKSAVDYLDNLIRQSNNDWEFASSLFREAININNEIVNKTAHKIVFLQGVKATAICTVSILSAGLSLGVIGGGLTLGRTMGLAAGFYGDITKVVESTNGLTTLPKIDVFGIVGTSSKEVVNFGMEKKIGNLAKDIPAKEISKLEKHIAMLQKKYGEHLTKGQLRNLKNHQNKLKNLQKVPNKVKMFQRLNVFATVLFTVHDVYDAISDFDKNVKHAYQ